MYLSAPSLPYYLASRGHLPLESVVDGDLSIVEIAQRHRDFKVMGRRQRGLFVKQTRVPDGDPTETLRREALCYQWAQSHPACAALARLMPKFVDYDAARNTLVLELLQDAENLAEYHARRGELPPEIGRLMGLELGTCHAEIGPELGDRAEVDFLPRQPPWILSIHRQPEFAAQKLSGGHAQLLSLLRQFADFQRYFDRLHDEWRPDGLIHGDIKFTNCLITTRANSEIGFHIVDWELADYGDTAWDVGGVFQAFLDTWIESMPFASGGHPAQIAARAKYPVESMQPAIRAFWDTYRETRGLVAADADRYVERCARLAASRMIQSAFESLLAAPRFHPYAATLMQVSLNVLHNPREALRDLLGIALSE